MTIEVGVKELAIEHNRLKRFSAALEIGVIGLAIAALFYRATVYWSFPVEPGESYGLGDVIDFGLGMLLFLASGVCAATGVLLHMKSNSNESSAAFRPAVVGITSFVVYYFLHPYVPRLL